MRPSFRNLNESFEGWAYRNGFLRQIASLEKQKFLERKQSGEGGGRLCRLTEKGRLFALGGRDPIARWSRPWDGQWRMVLFDVPKAQDARRSRLRRYLRTRGFGYLQNSVWITPDPLDEEVEMLRGAKIDVESLILLQAKPCAGESDSEIVAGAWDFAGINRRYARHLEILRNKPAGEPKGKSGAEEFRRWAASERSAWRKAVEADPLLPDPLLPRDYFGRRVWRERVRVLAGARKQLSAFRTAPITLRHGPPSRRVLATAAGRTYNN